MDLVHIIDGLIGIIVLGGGWFIGTQSREIKRIDMMLKGYHPPIQKVIGYGSKKAKLNSLIRIAVTGRRRMLRSWMSLRNIKQKSPRKNN